MAINYLFVKFVTFFVLLTFVVSSAYGLNAADDSLVLYISFDELNGDGKVIDHSQYENHGELKGDPKLVNGKYGMAVKLNGDSDWVEVSHHEILTVDKDVTVMAWVNIERYTGPTNAGFQGIVAKGNNL